MISLIKNELTKISHKKVIYIILVITLGFMILSGILENFVENVEFFDIDDTSFLREELKELDINDPFQKQQYISMEAEIEAIELAKKYDKDSWQRYIININAQSLIEGMKRSEGTADYDLYKKEYDAFLQKLNNNDWRAFAQEELNEINEQIKEISTQTSLELGLNIDNLKDKKQALEWRLEKNIPYGNSNLNNMLMFWSDEKQSLRDIEEREKKQKLTYNEKYNKQSTEEQVNLLEYAIRNNIDNMKLDEFNNRYNLSTDADSNLVRIFSSYGLFITIAIVVIAGTIVSEEFSKGTIKLLLVKPYKRAKILTAKFIACCIILIIMYVFVAIAGYIVGGIFNGFNNYTSNLVIYNFYTNSVENINIIRYVFISGISILPQYILIMTLAFTISTLFTNSALAVALPLLGMMGANIINEIAYHFEKAKFLMFFVTSNWDLSIYLFGKMPQFEPISLPFSICICLIYFVAMMAVSTIVFKKKEIKNI